MSGEQFRIDKLEEAIRKIKTMTTQGLRAQLHRSDRSLRTNYATSIKMAYKIEEECLDALSN